MDKNINISNLIYNFKNLRHDFWADGNINTIHKKLFGTLKVTLKINKKKNKTFFQGYLIVNNPIQIAVFSKHVVILYYTCPSFLTLKVATSLQEIFWMYFYDVRVSVRLREKCPYSDLFWFVFSPKEGKNGPEDFQNDNFLRSAS